MLSSKGRVASHSRLDLHVRTVLFLSHSPRTFLLRTLIGQVFCHVDLREFFFSSGLNKEGVRVHHMPSQDGSAEEPGTSIFTWLTLPTGPTHHFNFVRCCFLSDWTFWSVCECVRAEYARTVRILTSNVGRRCATLILR